jgi:hypothetical protein
MIGNGLPQVRHRNLLEQREGQWVIPNLNEADVENSPIRERARSLNHRASITRTGTASHGTVGRRAESTFCPNCQCFLSPARYWLFGQPRTSAVNGATVAVNQAILRGLATCACKGVELGVIFEPVAEPSFSYFFPFVLSQSCIFWQIVARKRTSLALGVGSSVLSRHGCT